MKPSYDAIVIGSGFGGAVAACRLSQAGVSVGLLERGRRYPMGTFPRDLRDPANGWLFARDQGLFDVKPINEITVLQAAGLGGGSLVYANVQMRPPPAVFDAGWPQGYSRTALEPYYDLAAYMLDVRPIATSPRGLPPKTLRMREAAARLDRDGQWFLPNLALTLDPTNGAPRPNRFGVPQSGCVYCGECIIGCNIHAKNTLDLNYLALAERAGCDIATRAEALRIAPGARGFRVEYRDHEADAERFVDAQWVFVCAGAVNSTELLLRCRDQYKTLPLLGERLGHGYSANGDFLVFAFGLREPFSASTGPSITSALVYDRTDSTGRSWFLLEDGGFPAQLASVARLLDLPHAWFAGPFRGRAEIESTLADALATPTEMTGDDQRIGAFFMMGRDRADGRVSLLPLSRRLFLEWNAGSNLPLYELQAGLAADVARALGGHAVENPFWRWLRLPMTVHNLGGCLMADGPADGVVDGWGESFAYPGLFVLDGSILPRATGTNPSATIAAVAERNVEHFVRARLGRPDWQPPERAQVTPVREPLAAVSIPVGGTASPTGGAVGLSFPQSLQGYFTRDDGVGVWVDARLTVVVGSLDQLLTAPTCVGTVSGILTVSTLTPDAGAKVAGGTMRMESAADGTITLTYLLPFSEVSGRTLVLEGSPVLHTTSAAPSGTVIREAGTDTPRVIARGTIRLPLIAIVRDLAGVRVLGSVDPVELASTLARGAGRLAVILGKVHVTALRQLVQRWVRSHPPAREDAR
jgi:cholesterol oxidase